MSMRLFTWILIIAGLVYLISPFDLVPESITGLFGLIDDLFFLLFLYWQYSKKLKRYQEQLNFYREKLKNMGASQGGAKKSESRSKGFDPFEVLEISRGASREEIETAYKKQMNLYHPDKVAHLGSELKKLAHQKTLEIQKAYEMLK